MIRLITGFIKRLTGGTMTTHAIRYEELTKEQQAAFDSAFSKMDEAFDHMRKAFPPPRGERRSD